MAATVTPNLTLFNNADAVTGWTAGSLDTDQERQGTGCVGARVSAGTTAFLYNNGSTIDLTGQHIYVWANCVTAALLNTKAAGGIRIRVAGPTATNFGEWYVDGSDTYPGGWKCQVIDTARAFDATGGTPPAITAIQHIGVVFNVVNMVSGNFNNCVVDVIRYGSGLTITGGTVADPATLEDIYVDDASNANAYGIIDKIGGVYFLQGRLTFGDSTGTGSLYFRDSNQIVVFQDKPVATSLYQVNITGNATGSTYFILGTSTGSGDGYLSTSSTTISAQNPSLSYDFKLESNNITGFSLLGVNLANAGLINFGTESIQVSKDSSLVDCVFSSCDKVTLNLDDTDLFLRNTVRQADNTTASFTIVNPKTIEGSRFNILQSNGFTSRNDSSIETLTVSDHDFTTLERYLYVYAKKTWNIIDPTWAVITGNQTKITFAINDDNSVNELYSLNLTVQEPDGTLLQNAYTYVYEGLLNQNLPSNNRQATNISGFATSNILTRIFTDNAGTSLNVVSYGEFALKVYKYTYFPFVGSLTVNQQLNQTTTLTVDSGISEPVQATAITSGSGIVVTEHTTQPLKVINYDGGTIAFADNDVVIGQTSGAQGTIREIIGDTASGTLVLHSWNGTNFTNDENLQVSSTTYAISNISGTGSFNQNYRWEIQCNSLSLQIVYNYLAAKMAEATPDAIFIDAIEWGEAEQSQLLYTGANGYFTERNVSLTQGVWLSRRGVGTIAYMTSDAGVQYIPPIQYSFTLTGLQNNTEVKIYNADTDELIAGVENSGSSYTYNYIYSGDINIYVVVFSLLYRDIRLVGLSLSNSNQSIPIQQQTDRVYFNP